MGRFYNYFGGPGAVGMFLFRLVFGLAFVFHGLSKIKNPFGWMGPKASVPGFLQALAALSEFGGGLALILGFLTPLACFGLMSTMFVAYLAHLKMATPAKPMYFVQPMGKPGGSYEDVAFYFAAALMIFLLGPGLLSLDALLFGRSTRVSDERLNRAANAPIFSPDNAV